MSIIETAIAKGWIKPPQPKRQGFKTPDGKFDAAAYHRQWQQLHRAELNAKNRTGIKKPLRTREQKLSQQRDCMRRLRLRRKGIK